MWNARWESYLHPQLILGRDVRLLAPVTQQVQHEFGNVTTGDRNMLDRRANDISIGDGNGIYIRSRMSSWLKITGRRNIRVTPSPLSMTTPVKFRSCTLLLVHDAASAKTA